MENPFVASLVKLQLPPGMGSNVAVGGFNLDADEDNCITVPKQYVPDLKAQGMTEFVAKPAKK